jgi:hypothetical protein
VEPGSKEFRALTGSERRILDVLLAADFPGNTALNAQASRALVREIDSDGSLEISVTGGVPAEVVRRVPVEAEADDDDGATVHVLLHVVDGLLNELEFYRDGEGTVRRKPAGEDLRILVL